MAKRFPDTKVKTLLAFIFLIQIIQSSILVAPYVQSCESSHTLMVSIQQIATLAGYTFIYNQYEDPQSLQSMTLVLKYKDGENFKFYTYGLDGQPITETQCPIRYTVTVYGSTRFYFKKNFLFIQTIENQYFQYTVCRYNPKSNSVSYRIPLSGLNSNYMTTSYDQFIISSEKVGLLKKYYNGNSQITIILIFTYADTGANPGFTYLSSESMTDYYIPAKIYDYLGNRNLLYKSQSKKFYKSSSDPANKNWVQVTSGILTTVPSTILPVFYALKGQNVVFTYCCSTEKIYKLTTDGSVTQQTISDPSGATNSQYFSDGIYSFVRITTKTVDWIYLSSSLVFGSKSVISLTDGSTHDIHYVGTSKNKITIFYTNGLIKTYERNSDGTLATVLNQSYSNQITGSSFSLSSNYLVKFKCFCVIIQQQKLYCYSTFNCVLLNKAGQQYCKGKGYSNTSW